MKTKMQETSLEAYRGVNLQRRELEVLNVIKSIQPCSNEDIAKAIGWEINRVTGRTNGLYSKGEIKDFDKAKNPRGRSVIRWIVAKKQLDLF